MPKYVTLQPKAIDAKTLDHDRYRIEFRGDYVHVVLGGGGNLDRETAGDYWGELKELCREHDCRRVLVEGIAPRGERTTGEVLEAGLRTAAVPNLWLAYCLEGFQATGQSALYETMAATRGVRVKFFAEKERALAWLRNNAR